MGVMNTAVGTADDDGAALYEVLRLVRPLHQWSARLVTANLRGHQLTMAMRAVVEQLVHTGPATVPQAARALWLPRQAVQRVVDAAVELGFLELRTNPHHRRSKLVSLTGLGARTWEEVHAQELTDLRELASQLDRNDIEAAIRVMEALTANARRLAEGEGRRAREDRAQGTPAPSEDAQPHQPAGGATAPTQRSIPDDH
jgi:DNA-binding MarR family transcriptional regulator